MELIYYLMDMLKKCSNILYMSFNKYKPVITKHDRRSYIAFYRNNVWQADLIDISTKPEGDIKYILVCVDVFTRQLHTETMKSKNTDELNMAFHKIIKIHGIPENLHADKEPALINSRYLKENLGINVYSTPNNNFGAGIVERMNRTIKLNIEKEKENSNLSFSVILKKVEKSINNSINRTIKMSPNNAVKDKSKIFSIHGLIRNKEKHVPKEKLNIDDRVVIAKHKSPFMKENKGKWNDEIHTVTEVLNTNPTMYKLNNKNGSFYKQQLQLIK